MGWQIKSIGETCGLSTGGTPSRAKPEYFENGEIKWLVSGDIHQKEIFDCDGRISELGLQSSNTRYLPKNSVMIALNGQGKTRGSVSILRTEATCNQSLVSISPNNTDELIPEFLYVNLHGRYEEIRKMTGDDGNDRRGLNMPLIRSIKVPLPPIPEQQRIVAILDQAFADIEKARANAEKNLKNARELFDSYLNQVFSQRGEGWVDRTLGEISDRVSVGHVGPTTEFYCDANIGVPFIRSQNVKPYVTEIKRIKYITQEFHNSLKKSQLQSGDLLFVRVGANRGDCCALREFQGELNCANIVFARPRGPSIDFLEYFCNSPIGQRCLLGMTTGSAQGVINTKSVAQLKIPLPPREQQLKVVDSINRLRVQAEQLDGIYINKINSLDELKKSLLQKAFSGELTKSKGIAA